MCVHQVTGEKHFKGDNKGCGINIDKLQEEEGKDDNDDSTENAVKFCEGVFPLHNPELKEALEKKWMPLKKPNGFDWAGLPVSDIKDYFGEEVNKFHSPTSFSRFASVLLSLVCNRLAFTLDF